MASDGFSDRYGDLLTGGYDCVDRIVLNAYYPLGHNPGGFRVWWRRLHGDDAQLDDTHLMRMAGRFARRVSGFATAHGIPVIDCGRGERKHRIAEDYLAAHTVAPGLFLILVTKAPASVWQVERTRSGAIRNLAKRKAFVNHYSFHVMDPDWGHLVIKMSGHPPFAAKVILNGHEYLACQAQRAGVCYTKEGNCFTWPSTADGEVHGVSRVVGLGWGRVVSAPTADAAGAGLAGGTGPEVPHARWPRPARLRRAQRGALIQYSSIPQWAARIRLDPRRASGLEQPIAGAAISCRPHLLHAGACGACWPGWLRLSGRLRKPRRRTP